MKLLGASPWAPLELGGRKREVRYRARFWEGPTEAGQTGRYVERDVRDSLYEKPRADGLHRAFLNTAPSVSYHAELMRFALKA